MVHSELALTPGARPLIKTCLQKKAAGTLAVPAPADDE